MPSGCTTPHSEASSSSSRTALNVRPAPTHHLPDAAHTINRSHAPAILPPDSFRPDSNSYTSSSYSAKGKHRAGADNAPPSEAMNRFSMRSISSPSPTSTADRNEKWVDSHTNAKAKGRPKDQPDLAYVPLLIPTSMPSSIPESSTEAQHSASSSLRTGRDRRIRRGRDSTSRSVAPSTLRSALATSPTTGSASQFVSLLGQPVAVSASISTPEKSSAVATSAALPSLYKASRGRSTNVSPSRRWDRRGASASVLSGASASGSGGEGDDASDEDQISSRLNARTSAYRNAETTQPSLNHRLPAAKEEALFPSDDDDESPQFSSSEEVEAPLRHNAEHRRRLRRWSSIERERRRGMRILLREQPVISASLEDTSDKTQMRRSTRSANRHARALEDNPSDVDVSSSPSSCTSSCDLNYVATESESPAIPIKERGVGTSDDRIDGAHNASVSVGSGHSQVPSSTDGSDDPSPAVSTPSTSLVQRSPPGLAAIKPIIAIPVTSGSDPLLGLATPSVEDMIQVDQVEYFPEEAISAQLSSAQLNRKASTKQSKKSSWIIGDFESEPESEDELSYTPDPNRALNRSYGTATSASAPSSSASSYQARLASLQSQLRIWSRSTGTSAAPRTRQISSSSEEHAENDADVKDLDPSGPGILSASWRNLARLPNLILLPGLAARQARESLASASKPQDERSEGSLPKTASSSPADNDFAHIYRVANSVQGSLDQKTLQAQRNVALRSGRPPSPSPSPSPPASLLGSRQSSNDSISTSNPRSQASNPTGTPRRGRGVPSPLEADRDPSAYVSGLGQPIDPDTELSSVVQLQTFRSRSRSRPAEVRPRSGAIEYARSDAPQQHTQQAGRDEPSASLSPRKLGQPIELEPTEEETSLVSMPRPGAHRDRPPASKGAPSEPLSVQIPALSTGPRPLPAFDQRDTFTDGPAPTDTASAPTSPTYRPSATSSASSSADETDSIPSPPRQGAARDVAAVDVDGFRVVRRRHRRGSSGPRSLRPKVDAPVPQGFSAFAVDEVDEDAEKSGSDGEVTPSPTRARTARGRRERDSSPRRTTRQCAVGLFGSGVSNAYPSPSSQSSSRSRRSSRRDAPYISVSTPIRSGRSSPDLTYAAAAAMGREGEADGPDQGKGDPSPPRGSRGRRGAVKVVASSVGQRPSLTQPLLLGGLEGLRRGPSYPPRAVEILEDGPGGSDVAEDKLSVTQFGRGRSASSPTCSGTAPPAFRFRLLSNSSHLLMLSLELDMIKKQKISAPLKPRWGKHRANDFAPLLFSVACFIQVPPLTLFCQRPGWKRHGRMR